MKSFFSVLLAVAMLLSFAACTGGSSDTPKDTTPSEDTTAGGAVTDPVIEYEKDDLPDDLDFDGALVRFLVVDKSDKLSEICTDELNSEIVNDSVYNREKYVEDRLDVELEAEYVSANEYEDVVEKQHASDDDIYLHISPHQPEWIQILPPSLAKHLS